MGKLPSVASAMSTLSQVPGTGGRDLRDFYRVRTLSEFFFISSFFFSIFSVGRDLYFPSWRVLRELPWELFRTRDSAAGVRTGRRKCAYETIYIVLLHRGSLEDVFEPIFSSPPFLRGEKAEGGPRSTGDPVTRFPDSETDNFDVKSDNLEASVRIIGCFDRRFFFFSSTVDRFRMYVSTIPVP